MSDVVSLLMCVGEQYYKLFEAVKEYSAIGISKRIPLKSIPMGLVKGASKILVAHPAAIVKVTTEGKTLYDLAYALLELGVLDEPDWVHLVDLDKPYWTGEELQPNDYVPEGVLVITVAFSKLPDKQKSELVKEYGLEFCMGVFGYSPFGGFEVVLRNDETELPDELKDLQPLVDMGYVQPVHVRYTEDEEEGEPV